MLTEKQYMELLNLRRRVAAQREEIKSLQQALEKAPVNGAETILALVLWVLKDKHNAPDDDIMQFHEELKYQLDSINKGYTDIAAIRQAMKEEYDIEVCFQ